MAAARSVIANETSLAQGCVRIDRVLGWLESSEMDYAIFRSFLDEARRDSLPLGTDRLLWNPARLAEKDELLQEIIGRYRRDILEACWNIVERFG